MRINEIRKNAADVTLDKDDLVLLGNALYFYEKHYKDYPDDSGPNARFHDLSAQVITARDICQYGHMDDFSFGSALWHKYKANTNQEGCLYETCKQVYDDVTSMDAGTDKTCMEAGPEV